jgi:hypothetical protein
LTLQIPNEHQTASLIFIFISIARFNNTVARYLFTIVLIEVADLLSIVLKAKLQSRAPSVPKAVLRLFGAEHHYR